MLERIMTILCMIIGAFTFAYGLTNVCTLLFNHNKYQVEFESLTDDFNEFLDRHQIPLQLQQKIQAYLWFRHNSSTVEDSYDHQDLLLRHLSPALRDAVTYHSEEDIFHSLHVHRSPTLAFDSLIRVQIAAFLTGQVYPPDEEIRGDPFRDQRHDLRKRVFYLSKGLCAYKTIRQDGTEMQSVEMYAGSSFGEREVLLDVQWSSLAAVRAVQHSDVYSIAGSKLLEVMGKFPDELEALRQVFERRGANGDYVEAHQCGDIYKQLHQFKDENAGNRIAPEDEDGEVWDDPGDADPGGGVVVEEGVGNVTVADDAAGEALSASTPPTGSGTGASGGQAGEVQTIMAEIRATQEKLHRLTNALEVAMSRAQ